MSDTPRGPLDKLPAPIRHLLIAVVPLLLAWIGTDVVPALHDRPALAGALAVLVQLATLYATPLTRQYGPQPGTSAWDAEPIPAGPPAEDDPVG